MRSTTAPRPFQGILCSEWSIALRNNLRNPIRWSPEPLKLSYDVNGPFHWDSTPKALPGSARLWMVNYANDSLQKQNHVEPKELPGFPR